MQTMMAVLNKILCAILSELYSSVTNNMHFKRCVGINNRHSNSPDFTGSLPKIHAISWSPDFYEILPIFQNIQEMSLKNHKYTVFSTIIVCLDLFMKLLYGNL
jgi:hypothetical protein